MVSLLALLFVVQPNLGGIRWDAPQGCPDAARVRAWVDEELGERDAEVDVDVEVRVSPAGWGARIDSGGASRHLEDPDCEALSRAIAVVIAVDAVAAVEPDPAIEPTKSQPEPLLRIPAPIPAPRLPPEPAPHPGTTVVDESPVVPERRRLVPQHWLGVSTGAAWGPVDALAGAVSLRYRGVWGRWGLGFDAAYHTPRVLRYAEDSAGGRLQSVSGAALGCVRFGQGPVVAPLCGGTEVGLVLGHGVDAHAPRAALAPWMGARLDFGVRGRLAERLEVGFEAQGGIVLVRPAFAIGERDPLTRAPFLQARGMLSLLWRLK